MSAPPAHGSRRPRRLAWFCSLLGALIGVGVASFNRPLYPTPPRATIVRPPEVPVDPAERERIEVEKPYWLELNTSGEWVRYALRDSRVPPDTRDPDAPTGYWLKKVIHVAPDRILVAEQITENGVKRNSYTRIPTRYPPLPPSQYTHVFHIRTLNNNGVRVTRTKWRDHARETVTLGDETYSCQRITLEIINDENGETVGTFTFWLSTEVLWHVVKAESARTDDPPSIVTMTFVASSVTAPDEPGTRDAELLGDNPVLLQLLREQVPGYPPDDAPPVDVF